MARHYEGIEIPEDDAARVAAVKTYKILETPPEEDFDRITRLAAAVTGCPVSYISIFDDTRSWLKSSQGLPPNRPARPREFSMCAPTICQTDMIVIPDLAANPRYANLPAVVNPPHAKFYCGVPLINRDAYALGTLCVWNHEATDFTDTMRAAMLDLAGSVIGLLEQRRNTLIAEERAAQIEDRLSRSMAALARAEETAYRLLPSAAAVRMLNNAEITPRIVEEVTVIGCTFEDLSTAEVADDLEARAEALAQYVAILEQIAKDADVEGIGMSGNTFIAIAGLRRARPDHVARAESACAQINNALAQEIKQRAATEQPILSTRVSMASGPVFEALVGKSRAQIGVWGPPVEAVCAP